MMTLGMASVSAQTAWAIQTIDGRVVFDYTAPTALVLPTMESL